jgi:hypothetical protein
MLTRAPSAHADTILTCPYGRLARSAWASLRLK